MSFTKEHRKNIGKSLKGKPKSEKHKANIKKTHWTKKLPEEVRQIKQKISQNTPRYFQGKHLSKEHKRKIRKGNLGKKRSKETKEKIRKKTLERFKNGMPDTIKKAIGKGLKRAYKEGRRQPGMKGRHQTKEARKKIGRYNKGKKSSWYIDGRTPEITKIRHSIESRLWRESNFARDNWTCQKCGVRSKSGKIIYLHSHHIYNFSQYPELRFAIDNGITFCKKCHDKFHKIYGKKNNTREQVEEFLLEKDE